MAESGIPHEAAAAAEAPPIRKLWVFRLISFGSVIVKKAATNFLVITSPQDHTKNGPGDKPLCLIYFWIVATGHSVPPPIRHKQTLNPVLNGSVLDAFIVITIRLPHSDNSDGDKCRSGSNLFFDGQVYSDTRNNPKNAASIKLIIM